MKFGILKGGSSARVLVLAIPGLVPEARVLRFLTYVPRPAVAERVRVLPENSSPEVVAREAVRHTAGERPQVSIPATQLDDRWLDGVISTLQPGQVLAITSRCEAVGEEPLHLPMMDFSVPASEGSVEKLTAAIREIGERRGAVLRSGKSFHYYGFGTLDREGWLHFLARCLLFEGLADTRYIAHRILSGACVLRITTTSLKPVEPRVVAFIDEEGSSGKRGQVPNL